MYQNNLVIWICVIGTVTYLLSRIIDEITR